MFDKPRGLLECFLRKGGKAGKYLKNNKILYLSILIITSGCFFCLELSRLFPSFYANAYEERQDYNLMSYELNPGNTDALAFWQLEHKDKGCDKEKSDKKCQNPKNELEQELYLLVGDYPIKAMVPHIAKFDRHIAALIIGIAKKESNWGVHAPTKSGEVCYNYWGYKGQGSKGMAMGYGCFATPQEGVEAIGGKIEQLVNRDISTPSKMVVWKCGSSCAGHSPESVRKWISDVSIYFNLVAGLKG